MDLAREFLKQRTNWQEETISEYLEQNEMKVSFVPKEEPKATTTFVAEDVLSKRLNWSRKEALNFLTWARKQIESDMTERGWESIDTLLDMYEGGKE